MTADVDEEPPGRPSPPPARPEGPDPPPAPGALARAADRVRALLRDNTWVLALMILANLVVILGAGALWYALGGDVTVVGVTAGALLAFAGAMLPLIRGRGQQGDGQHGDGQRGRGQHGDGQHGDGEHGDGQRGDGQDGDGQPLWPPLILAVTPLAVLLVGLPALGVKTYLESRPVDLTNDLSLKLDGPVEDRDVVTASAHADRAKSRLTVTFTVTEFDPASPVCAPASTLTVTPHSRGARITPQTRPSDETFTFDLGADRKDIRLTVAVRAERNCRLNLSVDSARLD
ncbi:hypothetical protein [Streptomyces sp. CC224B]|uniref:hypothetical protein n=1 Tax=Streptomyces sp. CC224B TaxID=3044571 RepID=UPI0024A7EA03|nr:hypothetical protein [Streptomyces sp. CC224B]